MAILGVGCWCGFRSGLGVCALLVAYVWLVYHFYPFSAVARNPHFITTATISTAVLFPPFALLGGAIHRILFRAIGRVQVAQSETERENEKRLAAEAELKASHEKLIQLNASLEERVAERTHQLEVANNELLGFTYSMSHDLRTPLRSIVSNSRMACDEAREHVSEATYARIRRVEGSALKMAQLIDNLLQYARLGQLPLNTRDVDLSGMAGQIADDLRAAGEGDVVIEPGMVVRADPEMIELVMLNLMENSWKYVRHGLRPHIEVGATADGAIFVRDQGIGFDMKYVDKVWQPFERLHVDQEYPGTGIGLANCKRIVSRHGGKMWAESALDRGTTIYFDLDAPVRRTVESPSEGRAVARSSQVSLT